MVKRYVMLYGQKIGSDIDEHLKSQYLSCFKGLKL